MTSRTSNGLNKIWRSGSDVVFLLQGITGLIMKLTLYNAWSLLNIVNIVVTSKIKKMTNP